MNYNWRQGFVIPTRAVRKMQPRDRERLEAIESSSVYANFSTLDNGKSRELIATFHGPNASDHAAFATKAVNSYDVFQNVAKAATDFRIAQNLLIKDLDNEALQVMVNLAASKLDESLLELKKVGFFKLKVVSET